MILRRLTPLLLLGTVLASAASAEDRFATFISGSGTDLYLASSLALPFLRDGSRGGVRSLRTFDALATTGLLTEGLKGLTRVPRPDNGDPDSFPSGHSAAAFCAATMMSSFHPNETPYWFAGAVLIAESRLTLGRHRPADVLAGAALGFFTARAELSSPRGLLIAPFVTDRGGRGVQLALRF